MTDATRARASTTARVLPPLLLFGLVLLLWESAVRLFAIPAFVLPPPLAVAGAVREHFVFLTGAAALTGLGALAGFAASLLVGTIVSIVFSQSRHIERAGYPYAIFLQTVPIVAVAPLVILWFGTGFVSVVVVAFVIGLFPIIANGTAGLTAIDPALDELFSLHGAGRWRRLWKLQLPHAVPAFVTGARTSSGLAVIGAIVGEFFAGYGTDRYGLGYLIIVTSGQLKTAYLFAAVLASALLGFLIFTIVGWIGDHLLARWKET